MQLMDQEGWQSLSHSDNFKKYRAYLQMRLDDLKEGWSAGRFYGEDEARAQAEAEELRHEINLTYDDLSEFYISTGRKKESEDDSNSSE